MALCQEISHKLVEAVVLLNRERLNLIPRLSARRQQAMEGFSKEGMGEVKRELRLLHLVLTYHRHVTMDLVRDIRIREVPNYTVVGIFSVLIPWLFLVLCAVWFTRRSRIALSFLDQKLASEGRLETSSTIQRLRVVLRVLRRIRRPLEWIVFLTIGERLLPVSIRTLLEVQLLSYVVRWVIGGFLVVHLINALAAGSRRPFDPKSRAVSDLRLRSLRMVGWVVVGYALGLGLSSRLVGEGAMYSWIRSTSWIAAIPVYLVLVGWWKSVVFERTASLRRKSSLHCWILAHPDGWKGFVAAMLAAVQLFSAGSVKIVRRWMGGFQIARRVHAYLFKRKIDRLSLAGDAERSTAISTRLFDEFSPDQSGGLRIPIAQEHAVDALRDRALAGRGGIVAMVAERGQGKSTTLRHLHCRIPGSLLLDHLPLRRFESVHAAISAWSGTGPPGTGTVLLDEAQALVRPAIGGLEEFDRLVKFARASGHLWVLAIDSSLWPFLSRARDQENLFDEVLVLTPWPESVIGELIDRRSAIAEVVPDYQDLVGRLVEGSDEQDRLDALYARKSGYIRMLWNHVRGNPGLALEAWRGSLVQVSSGAVRVRSLRDPDPSRLERLPDQWLFILRAVLQLSPASVEDVLKATRLPRDQVVQAFRQGTMEGFFEEPIPDHVRVSWQWLRSVDLLLERRHLLVNP